MAEPAIKCIQKPYPYKPGFVFGSDEDVVPPREKHPAFYGCFDWHSSVHGHWTLVNLVKQFPDLPQANKIYSMLSENLSFEHIRCEIAFLYSDNNTNFERTYGWAWLLKLAQELKTWSSPLGRELTQNIQPLADSIVSKYKAFLPKLNYPIRVGEHSNTAFGLTFAWDYAVAFNDTELQNLIEDKAQEFYQNDKSCPITWEPSGFDFLSPCLIEADLMSRILNADEFANWIRDFLPGINTPEGFKITPAVVSDRSDGKLVHLDGLNLSRAWCMLNIARKLGENNKGLHALAEQHLNAALPNISSGAYEGEHWLASFAVYAISCE